MSDYVELAQQIKLWGKAAGFADVRITDVDLHHVEAGFQAWLAAGYHGEMAYMAAHGSKRWRPDELVPGTIRVISVRMNYLPEPSGDSGDDNGDDWRSAERQHGADTAVISIYARGRDYHKVLRNRLQQLAERIQASIGEFGYRVFTDSAPVMEVALAEKAGLGWRGKHTLLLNREAGSLFFLGEILVDIPLPVDAPVSNHCGQCQSCIEVCPTQAIIAPYQLDARRCISYLTIELHGAIPLELRPLIGNRVYGCDDCQLFCPWNKFAQRASVNDFEVRNGLDSASMISLFAWTEAEFLRNLEGSPIRRIGHERWLRNLAVGLGNAAASMRADAALVAALQSRLEHPSEIVREHVQWALEQHAG
ncbi:MAG: tRNA epoxyqueuosine(34) reductase QueG [Undibacterium sp.]|uniref:tRNA epoxyqueuosine(34) reductase QueG n=1 Tax=Undibacterium sp. TaxID=1914977 RepID=UPI0027179D1C|nr:tRNA epoxyqueuosine(34) reductase QueG [Undibacterium sp.]MDO8653258.1 tRNA epoxyqueuosine(34) reductase QueG [Undibacterium sp.]